MTAPSRQCQPKPAEPRRDVPSAEALSALADEIEEMTVPVPRDLMLMKNERALLVLVLRDHAPMREANHHYRDCMAAAEARIQELATLVEGGLAAINAARHEEQASMNGHDVTADKYAKIVMDWQRSARAALSPKPAGETVK